MLQIVNKSISKASRVTCVQHVMYGNVNTCIELEFVSIPDVTSYKSDCKILFVKNTDSAWVGSKSE